MLQDLLYWKRACVRNPGTTLLILLTLALGIGASTAIVSVVNSVLITPLPFKEPARLVGLRETLPDEGSPLAYRTFAEWRDRNTVFESIAAMAEVNFNFESGDPVRISGMYVSSSYFTVIRVLRESTNGLESATTMDRTVNKKPRGNQWLICPKPNPQAKVRLFCFPYAGGGAQIYHKWHTGLPSSVEVYAVQPPGRGNRITDTPFTQLMPLVQAVADGILPALDKPFVFFGHSMGAIIAFELARLLREKHAQQPLHLFVSGRMAPQIAPADAPTYHLPDDEFLENLRELNGTPKELLENAELMEVMLPLLRADFEVCQTYAYVPGAPLTCPLTVFGGLEDEKITLENFQAWKQHTSDQFVLRMFPGDHFFIHSEQSLLLRVLSQELDRIIYQKAVALSTWRSTELNNRATLLE